MSKKIIKNCSCCGDEFKVSNYRKNTALYCSLSCIRKNKTPWNKGKKGVQIVSLETRKKLSESHKGLMAGEKNHWWKDGRTKNTTSKYNQIVREEKAGRRKPEKCEVCGTLRKLFFDHDHKTNKFRGWICIYCNSALGYSQDSIERLYRLAEYLKKNRTGYSKSNVVLGKESLEKMYRGMKVAFDSVRITYGCRGMNASIEHEFYPYHLIANDFETIIQAIEVEDPVEKLGLSFLKELSSKVNNDSGDGRKTTLLICDKILELGLESELSGMELKRELDALIPVIEQKIDEQKTVITEKEVHKVATIAGESDTIGRLLGGIYEKIGKDGIIIPESSGTYKTDFSIIEGVRFEQTGYLSPYMVFDEDARKENKPETKAIYENPVILVTKNKISKDTDIENIIELCIKGGKPLVIFTDDMDSGVAQRMIATHRAKVAKILIIKAPVIRKQAVFEDFAKITGATIVEDSSGINFKNLKLEHLGTCGKITVDKEETIVLGTKDISGHISELKKNDDIDSKLRLCWLQTKTCILKLGANSESELAYLRLKCYDAINSSKLALKDGVVKGGGQCLALVADSLPADGAGDILRIALIEPLKQNCINMGLDVNSGATVPNFDKDVVDAAAVVKNAVRNAIALASTILTTGVVIVKPKKEPENKQIHF